MKIASVDNKAFAKRRGWKSRVSGWDVKVGVSIGGRGWRLNKGLRVGSRGMDIDVEGGGG